MFYFATAASNPVPGCSGKQDRDGNGFHKGHRAFIGAAGKAAGKGLATTERQLVSTSISETGPSGRRQSGSAPGSVHRQGGSRLSPWQTAPTEQGERAPRPRGSLSAPSARPARGCSTASPKAIPAGADGFGPERPSPFSTSPLTSRRPPSASPATPPPHAGLNGRAGRPQSPPMPVSRHPHGLRHPPLGESGSQPSSRGAVTPQGAALAASPARRSEGASRSDVSRRSEAEVVVGGLTATAANNPTWSTGDAVRPADPPAEVAVNASTYATVPRTVTSPSSLPPHSPLPTHLPWWAGGSGEEGHQSSPATTHTRPPAAHRGRPPTPACVGHRPAAPDSQEGR